MSDAQSEGGLPHLSPDGRPRMVDVSEKPPTSRTARAEGLIRMREGTLVRLVREGGAGKGDVLRVAELAGIQGGKRTSELIPLCHALPEVSIDVHAEADESIPGIRITASAKVRGSTGVEMEALTAVSLALLTIYDMGKALEREMRITDVRLVGKAGGRSGNWAAEQGDAGA